MAGEYAQALGLPVLVLHKQRESGTATRVTHLVGEVRDRSCLIIDDIVSTGGTIAEEVATLLEAGARPDITIAATHGLLIVEPRALPYLMTFQSAWLIESVSTRACEP